MIVKFHNQYRKHFAKLPYKLKVQAVERVKLFEIDPNNPQLNNHSLIGEYEGCKSINISGDVRALYRPMRHGVAYFIAIGSHSKLYK